MRSILEASFTLINNVNPTESKELGEVNSSVLDKDTTSMNNNVISQQNLEMMGTDELLLLCKEYRNRVVTNANENDIITLQRINSILEEKAKIGKMPTSNTSHSIKKEFEGKMHCLKEETISSNITDKHISSDDDCTPTIQFVKQSISKIPCQLYAEEDEDEDETIQITPLLQSSKSSKYLSEEVDGKTFHCDICKSLELKTLRVRRRQSLECDSKRQKQE